MSKLSQHDSWFKPYCWRIFTSLIVKKILLEFRGQKMEIRKKQLVVLVNSALLTLSAQATAAEDPAVAALTQPVNQASVSVIMTDGATKKFGEYSGLIDSTPKVQSTLQYLSGSGYNAEGAGNYRFGISADLNNVHSNQVTLSAFESSSWFAKINYNELRHYVNEGFSTPLNDIVAGKFTLPTNFGIVKTTAVAGVASGTNALTATQQNAFRKIDVFTGRTNEGVELGSAFELAGEQLNAQFSLNRLTQTGGKVIAAASDMIGTDGVVVATNGAGYSLKAEAVMFFVNPTDYRTDTVQSSVGWKGQQSNLTLSYGASIFQDNYLSVSWENPFTSTGTNGAQTPSFMTNTMSTAPNNVNHQFGLQGGYDFTDNIKFAGNISRGINTQNDELVRRSMQVGTLGNLPFASLNGLVVNTHADSKLTARISKQLKVTVGARYDLRDNQTQSGKFYFRDLPTKDASATENRMAINTPLSTKKVVYDLATDVKLNAQHSLRAAYEYEIQDRWCNNEMANNVDLRTQVVGQAPITVGLQTAGNCVAQPHSTDGRVLLSWKGNFSDLNASLNVSRANRQTEELANFYNPIASGQNNQNYDLIGFNAAYNATRTENAIRGNLSYQPNENWNLSSSTRFVKTAYDLALGVTDSSSLAFNFDALYTFGNGKSVSAYYSRTGGNRVLKSGVAGSVATAAAALTVLTTAPTQTYTNDLTNRDDVIGINGQYRLSSKLSFAGDASLALASSVYQTSIDSANTTCIATNNTGCGVLPDITSRTMTLKLSAQYKVSKEGALTGQFVHQQMTVADYFYNGYQYGYTPTSVMPTGETAPNYKVNMLTVSYAQAF
jgi:MtrB/PioB family decaheme-associated outer membrane protein